MPTPIPVVNLDQEPLAPVPKLVGDEVTSLIHLQRPRKTETLNGFWDELYIRTEHHSGFTSNTLTVIKTVCSCQTLSK